MLLVDCLPAHTQRVRYLLPRPTEFAGPSHLKGFEAFGEFAQGVDCRQAGGGVVSGSGADQCLGHASTIVDNPCPSTAVDEALAMSGRRDLTDVVPVACPRRPISGVLDDLGPYSDHADVAQDS
jgi:hypothetical protein